QIGKQLEHADHRRRVQRVGPRIDRAQRSEKRAVGENDRKGNIALQAVGRRRVVVPVKRILGDMIDDDRLTVPPYLVAYRGLDLQLTTRLQAEGNIVADRAG